LPKRLLEEAYTENRQGERQRKAVEMRIQDMEISDETLRAICERWKIRRLELFGSARTGSLRPDSDIDLLVEFEPDEQWSLMDLARAEEDLSLLFGRRVDLVDRKSLERSTNWIRREAILGSTEVVYGT
jgi:predicted nucleotidyltransferase